MHEPDKGGHRRSRRRLLLAGLGAAGALVVGWGLLPPRQRLHAPWIGVAGAKGFPLNGWVSVAASGRVTVMLAKCEMGQGVTTALAMLVAEELDVPLPDIDIAQSPLQAIYGDTTMAPDGLPFRPDDDGLPARSARRITRKLMRELGIVVTGASSSVKDSWIPLREAGAAARARLLAAAAAAWHAPLQACRTEAGRVLHADGRSLGYGELAQAAASVGDVPFTLKAPRLFRQIGRDAPRLDSPSTIDGSACFGLDVRLPGLLYATVAMCPAIGGKLVSWDPHSLTGLNGIVRLLPLAADRSGAPEALAIVATSRWATLQALDRLRVSWAQPGHAGSSSADTSASLRRALDGDGFVFHRRGEAGSAAGMRIQAEYSAPYLAHAALEPVNCTARLLGGRLGLWVPTQAPSIAVAAAARAAGLSPDSVDLQVTRIGGAFGRRLDCDMVVQAAAIARAIAGAPVQLMWTREQDFAHDFYRPAAAARLAATLDDDGRVLALESLSASGAPVQQLLHRAFGLPRIGPDRTTVEGLFDHPYAIPYQRIAHVTVDAPLPLGPWRSVGHSHNAFFKESFIDELANAAGVDPVEFRRSLLKDRPRHRAVLDAAVALAGQPRNGSAHGVALHEAFGSIVAQVAEVSVDGARIRVHRISCAVDCGIAVHPDGVRQQVESAVYLGLSAALHERIDIEHGRVRQTNYVEYPTLRSWQMPQVDVVILPSGAPPEGMGEPATPPVAPAVANAVFRLTGRRLRDLPLSLA